LAVAAPTAATASPLSWSYPSAGGAGVNLSCPSSSLCVTSVETAVCCGIYGQLIPDAELLVSTDPTDPRPVWTVAASDVEDEYDPLVTVISCPSVSLCVASRFKRNCLRLERSGLSLEPGWGDRFIGRVWRGCGPP
jgi:hypothetical protein